jgi:nitrate/TMAO reductase-like tetraheme cytochrome c subunit
VRVRNLLIAVTRNPLSLVGSAVALASGVLIATLVLLSFAGMEGNPYVGILSFLILPGFMVLGLALVPIGIVRHRRCMRRAAERGEGPPTFPIIDLNQNRVRRMVGGFLLLSLVNVVILATATYKGVEVMESTEFCGTTCHTVMQPEHTAYEGSPHSRVKCVECHIGPGADWFVKSKLSGAWQVVSVALDLYPKPIPTPIHNLRPARETCEQCHWPDKFVGDRLKVITHYADDEANTEMKTVLLLRVGGIQGRESQGIHWHVDPANRIRYRSDHTRETIYDIELVRPDGTVKRWSIDAPEEADGEHGAGEAETTWREMDCIDCHNRPTHIYRQPERALDEAIQRGEIDRSLPYVRREGLRALTQNGYASHEEARRGIAEAVAGFYRDGHPELVTSHAAQIEEAGRVLGDIYARNVFPEMKVGWGTYPDHIGHTAFDGCFRCHDDLHETEDGETISQDCFTCHSLLAMEEEDPEILEQLQP